MLLRISRIILCIAIAGVLSATAFGKNSNDRVQFGRDIHVSAGESAGDLVCIGCSILVRGQTSGDAVAVGGNITLEDASVGGDSVTVIGSVRLLGESHVGGDAVSVIGSVRRDPAANVGGDVTSMGGPLWVLLIVWLFQRARRPQPAATAYPGGVPSSRM